MLYACAARFDVTINLEKFLVFGAKARPKFSKRRKELCWNFIRRKNQLPKVKCHLKINTPTYLN